LTLSYEVIESVMLNRKPAFNIKLHQNKIARMRTCASQSRTDVCCSLWLWPVC